MTMLLSRSHTFAPSFRHQKIRQLLQYSSAKYTIYRAIHTRTFSRPEPDSTWVWKLSGLARDGTAESVLRDQISGVNGDRRKSFFLVQLTPSRTVNTQIPKQDCEYTIIMLHDILKMYDPQQQQSSI